jgi:exosortase/archaeosortase family protein
MTPTPLIALSTLLLLFGWTADPKPNGKRPQRRSIILQITRGLALLLFTLWLSYWSTHPSLERFIGIHTIIQADPVIAGPLMGSLIFLGLTSPIIPLTILLLPFTILRRYRNLLTGSAILGMLYLGALALEASFFAVSGPVIVRTVSWIVGLLPGPQPVTGRWDLAFREFRVTVGPQCSEFSATILFVGLFIGLWFWLRRSYKAPVWLGVLLGILGIVSFWIINILRITAIVVIGGFWPEFAIGLFHGSAGFIVFLIFFAAYMKIVMRTLKPAVKS